MESRLIYESDKTYLNKIEWVKIGESEWKYLDIPPQEKHLNNIIKFLNDSRLYLVIDRTESKEIAKAQLREILNSQHGKQNFRIWTRNFRYVVEFNKVGIYKTGEIGANGIGYFLANVLKAFFR